MRLLVFIISFVFFSCGQSADKSKKSQEDSLITKPDSINMVSSSKNSISEKQKPTLLETEVNRILQTKFPNH